MTFNDVEIARQTYFKKCKGIITKIWVPLVVVAIMVAISDVFYGFIPIIFAFGFLPTFIISPFVIIIIATKEERSLYQKRYTDYFVTTGLQKIFTNVQYYHDAGISSETVKQILNTGDRYSSNDFINAYYKNINFTQADVRIEEERETNDNSYYVELFYGRFLVFDFKRNFTSNIQVVSKDFPKAVLLKSEQSHSKKFETIKTESSDFNRTFKVSTQDTVDALYILDPAFMEKLQNLYKTCAKPLLLTFMNQKLFIAFYDKKDAFEAPSPTKPLDEKTELEKVTNDIRTITNFIDSLNLDRYFKRSNL